jgi:hypothetical protein
VSGWQTTWLDSLALQPLLLSFLRRQAFGLLFLGAHSRGFLGGLLLIQLRILRF